MIVTAGVIAWDGELIFRSQYILEFTSNLVSRSGAVLSIFEDFTGPNADYFSIDDDAIDGFLNEASELIKK